MLTTIRADLAIVKERDPAARGLLEILLCYSGLQALMLHRISHKLWRTGLPLLPRLLSQLTRSLTGIEIHPGARIGHGIFIDHGMGVVIGETAEIGDQRLLYQGVTLGGTGKESAKVLGAIQIGANTKIGAGSVVVHNVDADCTVVGIPGRVIHQSGARINPLAHSALPDAEANVIRNLMERIDALEGQISNMNELLKSLSSKYDLNGSSTGKAQNLKDREILEFLGETLSTDPS